MPRTPRRVRAALASLTAAVLLTAGTATAAQAQQAPLRDLADQQGLRMGAAVAAHRLDEADYRRTAAAEFNSVTHENALKWESVQPQRGQYSWSGADRLVEFAQQNGQRIHGHTLVWHSQLPSWVENGDFTPAELTRVMEDHIGTTMGRYRGQIGSWDVVNEPIGDDAQFRDSVFHRTLGEDFVAESLRMARAADPDATLFINDYNIDGINAKSDAYYELAQDLLAQGAPLDGIGFQGHLVSGQVPSDIQRNIQRFADLGLEVMITELDIRMQLPVTQQKLEQQARDYTRVVNACLAVPGCSGVTVWGVTDAYSWVPDHFDGQGAALPVDEDYAPKPAYWSIHEALGGDGQDPGDPGEPGTGTCEVSYDISSRWDRGAVVQVSVYNGSDSAIRDWSLAWERPAGEQITSSWNASVEQTGTAVTAGPVGWNRSLDPGGQVSFGFQTTHTGGPAVPDGFSLGEHSCTTR
ncbi:beta-xylanase [Nocardiopsis terrae]|uniref:Beta-xylanase n=1 Tax=Nocardiopsis terrae TaxID=372655 RepID=A0ABR9HG73_9ACTN|nr:endo-1,4-beta-xylanase [Nocardiopsis terrae]MBE1458029.1 endo-1,4-beta-xylanase [Nocardiopsis terrae]GHC82608.1 beta-xylanase [Nocardiopsis terrae]